MKNSNEERKKKITETHQHSYISLLHLKLGMGLGVKAMDLPGRAAGGGVLVCRVVHLGADISIKVGIAQPLQSLVLVQVLRLGGTDDMTGNGDGDVADPVEAGVEPALGSLLLGQGIRKTNGRGVDHLLGNVDRLAENGSETDSGEDVHVVTLARVIGDTISLDLGEGRSGGKDSLVVGELHGLGKGALGLA